jgi:glycosyltransferase involved in cell wall biosynthesis
MNLAASEQPAAAAEPLHVWLLSPYHTGSHAAWADGYQRHSRYRVTLLTMAGRFWKWRMQGAALELAAQAETHLATGGAPDAVLATDMVNLPVWLGLVRRRLPAATPVICYMHENQLTYPWRPGEKPDLTYAMINWLSQVAADCVLFNSRYHRDSWFDALPRLLKRYPDYVHWSYVDRVIARSGVAPVGIAADRFAPRPDRFDQSGRHGDAPLILWNQRWEYDKRPDRFFALLERLHAAGVAFRLAVAGENFRNKPAEFETARERLAAHIVHWGYIASRQAYADLVRQADLVMSTADYEFFGLSVLEALCAGTFAFLPARLSYPELIPPQYHAACLYTDDNELFTRAAQWLAAPPPRDLPTPALQQHIAATYAWPVAAAHLDSWILSTVARRRVSAPVTATG